MTADVAQFYSDVFAPEYFVLLCTLLLLARERRPAGRRAPRRLAAQLSVVALAWAVAYAIYDAGPLLFSPVPPWGSDVLGGVGLAVGFLIIGGVWTLREWGRRLPTFARFLILVTVAHTAIVPFWNISGHVMYTLAPAGFLTTLRRQYAPLLLVPAGMVFSRVLIDAHTWAQSLGGAAVAGAFLAGFAWIRRSQGGKQDARAA